MKRVIALMALTILTACDYTERADFRKERGDRLYKEAMADYRAGRIDAAIDGLKKATVKDPGNASARFLLACLLQDGKADYLGAFCAYREYLAQRPESDKAAMAADRLAKCEIELAKSLAAKHGLADKGGFVKENEALKSDLRAVEQRMATVEKEAESLRSRVQALGAERDRLLAIVKGEGKSDESSARAPSLKEAKDLLEEEDEGDRIKMSADVAALRAEEAGEVSSGSNLLPARPVVTNVVKTVERPPVAVRQIPETHVVREGDTLYGIAKRYYGRISAWKRIREANKERI